MKIKIMSQDEMNRLIGPKGESGTPGPVGARDDVYNPAPKKEGDYYVNPQHYKKGKVECIDAIESAIVGKKGIEAACVANIIKYLWRYEEKDGIKDMEKAKWYLEKLLSVYGR